MFVLHRKMIVHLLRTWAVLFLAVGLAKAEVTLENGAYRNLLVSFSPNLPSANGGALLHSMKELLADTSRVLHTAVGVRIADVTFLLPDSWDVSGWDPLPDVGTSSASLDISNVLVENVQDSAFGKVPLAHQFGGCGVPGSLITVPADFLGTTEDYYPKGKLLAREWLKYRYGVFDENGFPGDSRYPTHYIIPGNDEEVKVTDCTHPQVEYIFKDGDGNNCSFTNSSIDTCGIVPGEISSENVTSSLMYFHKELPEMEHLCGREHLHNNLSPSKQNILCDEKSIWKVLEQSPDFKTPATPEEYAEPEFHYVKQRKPKVGVLFESTDHLDDQKAELLFALRRFVYELPDGSHLGIHTFMANAFTSELRPMSELTSASRGNIAPALSFDTPVDGVCPLCALETAVDGLLAADDKEASIILIVGSSSTREDNSALVEKLKNSKLCVKVIALKEVEGYTEFLDQLPCQSFELVQNEENKAKTFDALYQSMVTMFLHRYTETPTSVVTSGFISKDNEILIKANPTASDFTIWLERVILEGSFRCSDAADNTDVATTRSELQSNLGVYTFQSQNKDVKCNLQFAGIAPTLTQVQMKTKPGEFVTGNVWIYDLTPADSEQQMPIIIYVKVNFGNYPVSGARVNARVTDPDGNVGEAFELHDDGKGDPDITKDDGVYSRYFFNFTKKGSFLVSVEVSDNGGMAKALKKGEYQCCGSEVKTHQKDDVPAFTRSVDAVFLTVSARPEVGYPPSKIIDLRVEKYEPPTLLEMKWTAPGGEVDSGKAQSYILKSFTERKDALENFDSTGLLLNITQPPSHSGGVETLSVPLDEHLSDNATHYLAMRAVGESGVTSPVSNVVTLSVPEDIRPTGDYETTTGSNVISPSSGPDKKTIGIVLGVLAGLLVVSVCVYLIIYFVGRRKRAAKKAEEERRKKRAGNNGTNAARNNIGLNSIPADAIVRHHNEVVKARSEHRDPPIFKEENLEDVSLTLERPAAEGAPEYSQVNKKKVPDLPATNPPKSPKRMTNV